jgi:Flp pilus assembly protein TadG
LQTGLIYFAEQSLETAAADTSRLILTGQAQNQGFDQGAFKTAVCARLSSLLSCSGIMIDVRTSSDFSSANTSLPVDQNGNLQKTFLYQPGAAGDIVVVRLMYQWPMYISLSGLSKSFADLANGQDILMATVVFRNEPYQ